MKKELNIQLDTHMELIQEVAFKSLDGIKVSEIKELRYTCKKDEIAFFNKIKLKFIIHLGFLGLEYKITHEVEPILFSYIRYLLHELPVENLDSDDKFHLSII